MSDVFANMLSIVDGAPQRISHYITLAAESSFNEDYGYSIRESFTPDYVCPVCGEERELKPSCRRKLFKPIPRCGREVMLSPNVSNLEWDVFEGYAIAAPGHSGKKKKSGKKILDVCLVLCFTSQW